MQQARGSDCAYAGGRRGARKFALYTDNRKIEKSKDQTQQEFDARWDQFRLVAEGQDPRGNKYERSYEVLDGKGQLRETLAAEGRPQQQRSRHPLQLRPGLPVSRCFD
jgi:hypothetical protein